MKHRRSACNLAELAVIVRFQQHYLRLTVRVPHGDIEWKH